MPVQRYLPHFQLRVQAVLEPPPLGARRRAWRAWIVLDGYSRTLDMDRRTEAVKHRLPRIARLELIKRFLTAVGEHPARAT